MKYADAVAATGSISEAARRVFVTQPTLTESIRALEEELRVAIFTRSNRGVSVTREGDEFLASARQILDDAERIREKYTGKSVRRPQFAVSCQHYAFATEAFMEVVKANDAESYDFTLRETVTSEIIDDVARHRSEIGILYLNTFNEAVIRKTLRENDLVFTPLFRAKPHVFIGKDNPLAAKAVLTLEDLKPYPRLSYEQGTHNSFYFSEEILSTADCDKELVVCDRATLFNLLIGMNGYTICSGVISEELNGPHIIAKPLEVDDYMEIGYILPASIHPSKLTEAFIRILEKLTQM
jgi:DNA-binding transcriptional LysR family regulator